MKHILLFLILSLLCSGCSNQNSMLDSQRSISTIEVSSIQKRNYLLTHYDERDFINITSSLPYTVEHSTIENKNALQELCFTIRNEHESIVYCDTYQTIPYEESLGYDYSKELSLLVEEVLLDYEIDPSSIAYFYVDPILDETITYQKDRYFLAASTIKVPLIMLYLDFIDKGIYTLQDTIYGIPISTLLTSAIRYSNNEATEYLFTALGSFEYYHSLLQHYADVDYPEDFLTSNSITVEYAMHVMMYLYEHQEPYEYLLNELQLSTENSYFRDQLPIELVSHKYGSYEGYEHDIGIFNTEEPFLAGIYTQDIQDAPSFIGVLGRLFYEYHEYQSI